MPLGNILFLISVCDSLLFIWMEALNATYIWKNMYC